MSTVFPQFQHMLMQSAKNPIVPLPSDVAAQVKHQRKLIQRICLIYLKMYTMP